MRALGPTASVTTSAGLLGAAAAAATAFALVEVGPTAGIALGVLPAAILAGAALLSWGRAVLLACALALPLTGLTFLFKPIPIAGSNIYVQDLIVLLAVGAWAVASLAGRGREQAPPVPRTPVLGVPFVLFAAAIAIATLRGHFAYGATLYGQPLRLVLYAGIVVTLAGLTVRSLYRLLLGVFYAGTVLITAIALFYLATGGSQTDQFELSTGGSRVLGISTTLYCAGAAFLALLSLRLNPSGGMRVLHLTIATLGLFCVVLGFGRAVYAAVALICVVILVASRSVRQSVLGVVPLALPFLILLAIFVPRLAPDLVQSTRDRVSSPPASDANVQWRERASGAVFSQIREQPLVGVGFGRTSEFVIEVQSSSGLMVPVWQEGGQDPHNGYLYLWAGGGLAALGSFVLILAAFAWDSVRRFRSTTDPLARLLLLWTGATLFAFLVNAASGTMFESPSDLLTIWCLLVLPAVVPRETRPDGLPTGAGDGAPPARATFRRRPPDQNAGQEVGNGAAVRLFGP